MMRPEHRTASDAIFREVAGAGWMRADLVHADLPSDLSIRWLTYDPEFRDAYRAVLSPQELQRLSAITHPRQRKSFVLGRAVARSLLGERLGLAPHQVQLRRAEDGAPILERTRWQVSIAHSGAHAVGVVGQRTLGIDLERIQPRREGLEKRILHEEEWADFEALPLDHAARVMLIWTLKEATLKAIRMGFRHAASAVRLEVDYPAGRATAQLPGRPSLQVWFMEHKGYYLAVAYAYPQDDSARHAGRIARGISWGHR